MPKSANPSTRRSRDALIDAGLLVVLVAFTVINFTLGEAHASARGWWIALILGLAFAKSVAIGYRYMLLGKAPRRLLLAFIGWAVVFFVLTTVLATS